MAEKNIECQYFGRCGGCTSQHIPYEVQLTNKKKVVERATGSDVKVFAGKPYGYRNRMDFVFRKGGLGFRKKGKWYELIDVEECPISNPKINQLLKEVKMHFKDDIFDVKGQKGTFRYAVIRTPQETSSISIVLNADSTRLAQAIQEVKEFAQRTTAHNVLVTRVPAKTDLSIGDDYFVVKGSDMLQELYLGKTFKYHVQGFFQNNSEMAEKMHEYVHALLERSGREDTRLLDLYAGVGTFGIINNTLYDHSMIVEGDDQCIKAAEENIKENNALAEARVLDAKQVRKLDLKGSWHCITDPPRSGMHPKTIRWLSDMQFQKLIYVSCNPKQLQKELLMLDYSVKSVALFDLFPQTPHMEAVVELEPNQKS